MRTSTLFRFTLILVMIGCLSGTTMAEVSARPHENDNKTDTLILADVGITDGVDPIPQIWGKVKQEPDAWVLNPSGADRGDGRPDIAYHPDTGAPVVVWAYKLSNSNYDIAISFWEGSSWSPIEFVSSTPENEMDAS